MQPPVTEYNLASDRSDTPDPANSRMCLTSSLVSFARWLFSPRLSVPWINMSAEFSFDVAHLKWDAFMQSRWPLPQECADTCSAVGGSPWANWQMCRLANRVFPSTLTVTRICLWFGFLGKGQSRHSASLHSEASVMNFWTSSDFVSCSGSPYVECRA